MSSRFDTEDELDGADLSELMDRSLSGLHLDPDALASGAMGAGRPLRRRRRLIAVAASVAAFGLVGAAGAYAINGLSTTRDQIVEPAKSANPSPSQAGEQRQLPARVAALRLEQGLGIDLDKAEGQESPDALYVGAVAAEDPKIGVSLNVQADFAERVTEDKGGKGVSLDDIHNCEQVEQDDCSVTLHESTGAQVMRYTVTRDGYRTATADVLQADGSRVALAVAYPVDGAYRISATEVAEVATGVGEGFGTLPSAADLAAAEREIVPWTLLDDSATEKPDPQPTETPDAGSRNLTAPLAALHLSRLAPPAAVEFWGFEKGRTVVAVVMIDRHDPQASGKAALRVVVDADAQDPELSCGDPGLTTCEISEPQPGVTMRQAVETAVEMGEETKIITVDVLRTDGTLVTVTGGNTAHFTAGHPRPGTSLKNVSKIALDEVWDVNAEPEAEDIAAAEKLDPFFWMKNADDF